jgi:hypothetical protein
MIPATLSELHIQNLEARRRTTMRVLGLLKADEHSEAAAPPPPEMMQRMGPFIQEITEAGVLLSTNGLLPSSRGTRVRLSDGKVTVIDGPFTESKELIASYALMEVKSMDEAVHWTKRFLEVLGGGECEIRPVFEASENWPEGGPCCVPAQQHAARQ